MRSLNNGSNTGVIILAAGKGTRMLSDLPKVLHKVAGRSMIEYPVDAAQKAGASPVCVVTGYKSEMVEKLLEGRNVEMVMQEEQLGTAHAVLQAEPVFACFTGTIIILCGDVPLLTSSFIKQLADSHFKNGSTVTVVSMMPDNPFGYGRIIESDIVKGGIEIVEEKDAATEQRKCREVNSGVYAVKAGFLFDAVRRIGNKNKQGEYYLTDIMKVASEDGQPVAKFFEKNHKMLTGVNTAEDLEMVGRYFEDQADQGASDF